MPRIRFLTAGAILWLGLLGSGASIATAAAQTAAATEAEVGQPLQLVPRAAASRVVVRKVVRQRVSAPSAVIPPKLHERRLSTRLRRTHVALATPAKHRPMGKIAHARHRLLAHNAFVGRHRKPAPPPLTEVAAASPTVAAFAPPAALEPTESEHAVRVTSADTLNEIDLAASAPNAPADQPTPTTSVTGSATRIATAAMLTPAVASDGAEAQPKPDAVVAFARRPRNEVGSTAWILQVMAALGGAVAAGASAWFLIGSTPQRTFG